MSFTKVGPAGGWSFGAKLTSAQMNQLDADHADALDKTIAGDTLSGAISIASSGSIVVNNAGGQIVSSVAAGIVINEAGGLQAVVASAVEATASGAIVSTTSHGITSTALDGIAAGGVRGISDGGHTGGIVGTVYGGIQPNTPGGINDGGIAGGITSTTPGGLGLSGGSSDWPAFYSAGSPTTRSRTDTYLIPIPRVVPSGWAFSSASCSALSSTSNGGAFVTIPLDFLHQGATLAGLYLIFGVQNSHTDVPGILPTMGVFRFPIGPGVSASSAQQLYSGGSGFQTFGTSPASPSSPPATGADWYNGGNNQAFGFIPNQNNVIDHSSYVYTIVLSDETGSNSIAGNYWYAVAPLYTNISNMQFP